MCVVGVAMDPSFWSPTLDSKYHNATEKKNIISLATASGATPLEEEVGGWPLKEPIVGSEMSVCLCVV